jgi:hypothetical protein
LEKCSKRKKAGYWEKDRNYITINSSLFKNRFNRRGEKDAGVKEQKKTSCLKEAEWVWVLSARYCETLSSSVSCLVWIFFYNIN